MTAGKIIQKWLEDYSVNMGKAGLQIPKITEKPTPLQTGEHDWPSWTGPTADNKSPFTDIKTDWSKGLQ